MLLRLPCPDVPPRKLQPLLELPPKRLLPVALVLLELPPKRLLLPVALALRFPISEAGACVGRSNHMR